MDLETAKKEFGLRVKSYRNSRNLTQEQFCSLTDLEQANLSNIENGKTYPGFMTICTMIEKGGIEPDFLFRFLSSNSVKYDTIDYEIMNILVTENYTLKDIFEIVDEYPHGYIVWPIGRRNFPFTGYVPLAKPTDEPYHIDINTLKAIKVNDNVADHILNEASFRGVDKAKFHHIVSSFNR